MDNTHYTTLPDHERGRRVQVGIGQFHVLLEERRQDAQIPTTRIVLTREQLLAFLVALPDDYLQAALRVKATGDPAPFQPRDEEQARAQE